MKSIRSLVTMLLFALLITPGYSLVIRSGQSIDITENEVINDDLIVLGRIVTINGKVNGDIWAFGQNIFIGGEVDGSVFTAGSTVDINVKKAKTVLAAGGNIQIYGLIERNVLLFGGSLLLDRMAKIGKDLVVYAGQLHVRGEVGEKINGGVGTFIMEGQSGDVDIKAEKALIKSQALILGNLVIQSKQKPIIEKGAQIKGETKLEIKKKEEEKGVNAFASLIALLISFTKIITLLASIIIGIIIIALFKRFARRIMDTLITTPWQSLGWGFIGIIVIPVATVLLFLILIGYPLAIFGMYIYSMLLYLSSIFVGLVLGEKIIKIFRKQGEISLYFSFIIGMLVLFILGLIPILGFIVTLFVCLFGAGMLIVGTQSLIKEIKEKELV